MHNCFKTFCRPPRMEAFSFFSFFLLFFLFLTASEVSCFWGNQRGLMGELLGSQMGRDTDIAWRRSKLEGQKERFFFGKVVFSWTNLLNIWFLEPRFMEYEKYLSMWKLIWVSCTLSRLSFFLPRLPLLVSRSATTEGHVSTGWNWTGWKLQNEMLSFPLSHLIPITLSCLHSVTKAIWDSQKNGVADASRPLPTVLSSFSLIPYPFLSFVLTSSPRRFELPRKTV